MDCKLFFAWLKLQIPEFAFKFADFVIPEVVFVPDESFKEIYKHK